MEYMNDIQMLWTIIAFSLFIGIVIWAWSGRRKGEFHEAENIIFDEDDAKHADINKKSDLGNKHHV